MRQTIESAVSIYDGSFGRKNRMQRTWSLAPSHRGLEGAGLIVINVRADEDRTVADAMLAEVARIRRNQEIRTSILGLFGSRTPVTAVVADLLNPKDPGTRKAIDRVKRVLTRRGRP